MKNKKMTLDDRIEKEYYARSAGVMIDIFDITKLFADVRENVLPDYSNIGQLVDSGIAKYCVVS